MGIIVLLYDCMRTTVLVEKEQYKAAMSKAANQGIFSFSELVRQLLVHYTADEAKQRMDEP